MTGKERILFLRKVLAEHNYLYYVQDNPSISDFDFDILLKELEELENKFPEMDDQNSPTKRVGGDITDSFKSVVHRYPMLSLGNTYSSEELYSFDDRLHKLTDENFQYICELKYDGVSISLRYKNGELVQAITRGDGIKGDDVTSNVRTVRSIPLKLIGDYPDEFEIRGEIFMSIENFKKFRDRTAQERIEKGQEPYANARNTASGSLRLLDSSEVASRSLDCYLYYMLGDNLPYTSHFKNLNKAREWGFKISPEMKICQNINETLLFINYWEENRKHLPYEIDGVVIKVDDINIQQEMDATAKFPRWAVAYKFKAEQALTRINHISYQVGRTGAITPVAHLDPVKLAGTTVKKATLHNYDQIRRLDLREGDFVYIEKGGDIIPKVLSVDLQSRDILSQPVQYLKSCPFCDTTLIKQDSGAVHYCPNFERCLPQVKARFEHFISRKAMNVDGLGGETIELLLDKKIIHTFSDLYSLNRDELLILDRMAEKSVDNLLNSLEESKNTTFDRVLFALGIRHVGENVAKKLVVELENIENLISTDVNRLIEIDEIGEKIACSVIDYFRQSKNLDLIARLQKAGLQFSYTIDSHQISESLQDMKIVISGVFNRFSRDEIKQMIEKHGGKHVSGISKNTTFVIAGNNMGPSKKEKAQRLGVKLITEEEFLEIIN